MKLYIILRPYECHCPTIATSVAHKSITSQLNRIGKYHGGDVTGLIKYK